jgi:SAM-dependent methyltransferase
MSNPLAAPLPWDLVADEYAEFTTPFFANYARVALDRAGAGAGSRVLDVACGPGTLALLAAKRGSHVTAVDFAPAMIQTLGRCAKRDAVEVRTQVADGQELPMADASYDAAFSMFGLIFFPDRAKGMRELRRVLVPGGVAAIASWQPMERFLLLADAYATMRNLLPDLPFGGGKAPLGEADEVIHEMRSAGFVEVTVEEVRASAETESLDEAWRFLCRGSAPFSLLRRNIGDEAWKEVERGILAALAEKYGHGRQRLTMVANLGVGRKPR